jgi:hypothetical protein
MKEYTVSMYGSLAACIIAERNDLKVEKENLEKQLVDLQENADLKDTHWQQVCTAFGFIGHADPEELIEKAARLAEEQASLAQCRGLLKQNVDAVGSIRAQFAEERKTAGALLVKFIEQRERLAEVNRWLKECIEYIELDSEVPEFVAKARKCLRPTVSASGVQHG